MSRPLLIDDLVVFVPEDWQVDEPQVDGERVQVTLRFSLDADEDELFVRMHKAPSFGGAILIEREPLEGDLQSFFADRLATFRKNVPSAKTTSNETTVVGGVEGLSTEQIFDGPGAGVYRRRLVAAAREGAVYLLSTTNAAGAGFDAAVRTFGRCVENLAWRAED